MRKGVAIPTVMAIVSVALSGMFLAISPQLVLGPENYIRENSVFLVSERVSSAVYAMDSTERAEMQLDLEANYTFEEENQQMYVSFGAGSDAIQPGVRFTSETGNTSSICISKRPRGSPHIELEEC